MIATFAAVFLAAQAGPAAAAAPQALALAFQPKTLVENGALQVVRGERAIFSLEGGRPVLTETQRGQLAEAQPANVQVAPFEAPGEGRLAAALDASAGTRMSVLKVWNGLSEPVSYNVVVFAYRGPGRAELRPMGVCSVKPGEVRTLAWPSPLVGVGLAQFKTGAEASKACDAVAGPPPAKAK